MPALRAACMNPTELLPETSESEGSNFTITPRDKLLDSMKSGVSTFFSFGRNRETVDLALLRSWHTWRQ